MLLLARADLSGGRVPEGATLAIPPRGASTMQVLSPRVLEITRIGGPREWDFASAPPQAVRFTVEIDGKPVSVSAVGFRRRARYGPDRRDDLRVACVLYLRLARDVPAGGRVRVRSHLGEWRAIASALRWSSVVHVNHEGYAPDGVKVATVGAWLGTLGELPITAERFSLVEDGSGRVVYRGALRPRPDGGFPQSPAPYQQVREADFSAWRTPGRYRVAVEGLGASFPFAVDRAVPANLARAYALGIYHQRCGAANALPFTRFVHGPCHTAPAEVPTARFAQTRQVLEDFTRGRDPGQTARPLSSVDQTLYPFVRKGRVDVHGGHHDAGDYSKYLIDSAQLVHALMFTADHVPGAARLDNLGLPESGDGHGDLLALARWEADFICRAQDRDGGFSFLVYPRDKKYEWDQMPDAGEPQVIFPKNTAATAACVAALAQTAASPAFRAQFPRDAARYLAAAKLGFAFLERAWRTNGRRGAYQRVSHYGAEFGDRDEIAWAEAEMFVATGQRRYAEMLRTDLDPADPALLRWGWWRLYEGWGCALRAMAFDGARRGMDPRLVEAARSQIIEGGRDQVRYARACAYRTSFPTADKRFGNAAWYAGADRAFDAVAAYLLDPTDALLETVTGNVDFDLGANPVNVSFVTGLGWRRPREIVSQVAANDRQVLPPSGIPVGSLRSVEPYLARYGTALREAVFPRDDDPSRPYPLYDRWSDTWAVQSEMVTASQARCLATAVFLLSRAGGDRQPWRAAAARIMLPTTVQAGRPVTARLSCPTLDPSKAARVVWERSGAEPVFGDATLTFTAPAGHSWIEAEVQWRDGRRAFASAEVTAR